MSFRVPNLDLFNFPEVGDNLMSLRLIFYLSKRIATIIATTTILLLAIIIPLLWRRKPARDDAGLTSALCF